MGNWQEVKLRDILIESKVESTKPNVDSRIRVLLNAKGIIKRPIKKETKDATKYFIRTQGQFIYGKQNIHKGAFGIVPEELDRFESSSDLPAFDIDKNCLPEWIDYFFKQEGYYLSLVTIARGAATKRVQPRELLDLKIPLPPIEVQKEIVGHFKNIETGDSELKQELTHQQTLLKKLRQQILQEAIEGKLTTDWRKQNPDAEPASELLAHIHAEKTQLIKDKKIKKQKPLPPINEKEKPFDLPEGWVWCRLGEILDDLLGGYSFKSPLFKKAGTKQVLRLGNIRPYRVHLDVKPVFIDEEVATEGSNAKLKQGDLLITMTGTRGKRDYCYTVLLNESHFQNKELYLNQRVGCLRFNRQMFSYYYDYCLKNEYLLNQIFSTATGAANQANIGSTALRSWIIPIPPLPEQKAIVTKVEKLLALCDQLETQIISNQTHAEQLMQAVLKEAFTQNSNAPAKAATNA